VNDSPVHTELQRVLAFDPREVVGEVVDRNVEQRASALAGKRAEARKIRVRSGASTSDTQSLANVAIAQIVEKIWTDRPEKASRDSFRGVRYRRVRRVAGKLGLLRNSISLLDPSDEQMTPSRQLIVDFRDVGIQGDWVWRRESKASRVEAIPTEAVWQGIST